MTQAQDKYSLVIAPKGEVGGQLQSLVDELAQQYDALSFIPHVTIVANILASPEGLEREKEKAITLAQQVGEFTVSLSEYGFTDEEFRCLFLLAHSPKLEAVYSTAATLYPQVNGQHFRKLPHLSVLYGSYPVEIKQKIIETYILPPLEFNVESFNLYKTNGPASSWRLEP